MRLITKKITVEILAYNELTELEETLIKRACKVRLNAQASYSHYWVGCSLITHNEVFSDGCNVENVNWSETGHGEECAINSAIARLGPCRIRAMAIVGAPEDQSVPWPPLRRRGRKPIKSVSDVCPSCGHCLQKIAENCFDKKGKFDPNVILIGYRERTGEIYRTTIGNAYPMPFLPQHLGVNYSKDPRVKAELKKAPKKKAPKS